MKRKKTLGGVGRSTVMLCSGFLLGLSTTNGRPLDDYDRKILAAASKALRAAGLKLYTRKEKQ